MGSLHNSRCHASASEADAANWGAVPPSVTPGKLSTVSFSGSGWFFNQYDTTATPPALVASSPVPVVSYPVCDRMESFNDGQFIGLGIASAMIIAYLIRIQGWGTR